MRVYAQARCCIQDFGDIEAENETALEEHSVHQVLRSGVAANQVSFRPKKAGISCHPA